MCPKPMYSFYVEQGMQVYVFIPIAILLEYYILYYIFIFYSSYELSFLMLAISWLHFSFMLKDRTTSTELLPKSIFF